MKPVDNSANDAPLHVAREIVGVFLNKPFSILQSNMSKKPAHIPRRMIVEHVANNPALIIATEAALQETTQK